MSLKPYTVNKPEIIIVFCFWKGLIVLSMQRTVNLEFHMNP